MIVFDRRNHKDRKSSCVLPEETGVLHERLKLVESVHSTTSQIFERSDEIFGIGLETFDKREITNELTEPQSDSNNHATPVSHSAAIDILNKAQSNMATFQSLPNLSNSGTEVSHRHFSDLNASVTLFSNVELSTDRDVIEHDKRIDDILKNWSMSREHIPRDGDWCFRAVARNIIRITRTGEIHCQVVEHLTNLGLFKQSEDSLVTKLRELTISEWSGGNRQHYENFLTTDNFENEVERFSHRGYFTGELGNLMVLAMANFLKMPIVIFSSLENFPTIPILPRQQSRGMPPLFISFNAAGCGHYDYFCRENYLSEPREKIGEEIKKEEKRA
ncbi:uncharacterized protein LOC111336102 [Stylophora pistillata]|nr:uncharacterized protein LOC111336102 [Stylophora pistillata]